MGCPTDPIADFLTTIRNGARAKKERVTTPASNITIRIAEILKQEGYIEACKVIEEDNRRFLRIHLRYGKDQVSAIRSLVRISKPGIHYYVGCRELPRLLKALGVAILSTSRGIMTDRQARDTHVGGEVLCKVW
jgi:small subunit ribosomal protein S8